MRWQFHLTLEQVATNENLDLWSTTTRRDRKRDSSGGVMGPSPPTRSKGEKWRQDSGVGPSRAQISLRPTGSKGGSLS